MQIIATHRERRRDDGTLSIEAVLMIGDVEYILERNIASRRQAQHIADEELRLIRRLVLARLRQLHTDKRPSSQIMQTAEKELEKHLTLPGERSEQRYPPTPPLALSPVPSGIKPNGKLEAKAHTTKPRPTISAEEL